LCPRGWVNKEADGTVIGFNKTEEEGKFFEERKCVPMCKKGYFYSEVTKLNIQENIQILSSKCSTLCGLKATIDTIINPLLRSQKGGVDCSDTTNLYVEACDLQSILVQEDDDDTQRDGEEKTCKKICEDHQIINMYSDPFRRSPPCLNVCKKNEEVVNPQFYTKFNEEDGNPEDSDEEIKEAMQDHTLCVPKELICPRGQYQQIVNGQISCKSKCSEGQIRLPGYKDLSKVSQVSECVDLCGKGSVKILEETEVDGKKVKETRCDKICKKGYVNPNYDVEENDKEKICIIDKPLPVESWNEEEADQEDEEDDENLNEEDQIIDSEKLKDLGVGVNDDEQEVSTESEDELDELESQNLIDEADLTVEKAVEAALEADQDETEEKFTTVDDAIVPDEEEDAAEETEEEDETADDENDTTTESDTEVETEEEVQEVQLDENKTVATRKVKKQKMLTRAMRHKQKMREIREKAIKNIGDNDLHNDSDPDSDIEIETVDTIVNTKPKSCRTWDYRGKNCFECYVGHVVNSKGDDCVELTKEIDVKYLTGCRQLADDKKMTCKECSIAFKAKRITEEDYGFVCLKINTNRIEHNQDIGVNVVSPNNILVSWDLAVDKVDKLRKCYRKYGSFLGEGSFVTKSRIGCNSTDENDEGKCTCIKGYRYDPKGKDCIPIGFNDQNTNKCLEFSKTDSKVCTLCESGYLFNGKCQGSASKACSLGCRSCYKEPPLLKMCGNDSIEKCLICDKGWCPSTTANGMICTKCQQDNSFEIENCLFHDNRKAVIKPQVMLKQDLSETSDKELVEKKLKRSVFGCYICKAGYVWIQSKSECAEVAGLAIEEDSQKNSILACRLALDEDTAKLGQCSHCYKNATRNKDKMCIQIKKN